MPCKPQNLLQAQWAITLNRLSLIKWKKNNNIAQYISLTSIKKLCVSLKKCSPSRLKLKIFSKTWLFEVLLYIYLVSGQEFQNSSNAVLQCFLFLR